jgi:cell division protein ZapA
MPSAESIEVTIFNQTYSLRSLSGDEHVRRIASLVDERMRQIASSITTHDVSKIAILAALNFADEMQSLRDGYAQQQQQSEQLQPARSADGREGEGGETLRQPESAGASWFDDIFDADMPAARDRGNRLSSQVSAKLQSLRRNDAPSPTIDEGEERRRT